MFVLLPTSNDFPFLNNRPLAPLVPYSEYTPTFVENFPPVMGVITTSFYSSMIGPVGSQFIFLNDIPMP